MATIGALSLLLTAGLAAVRAVKDEDGEGDFYQTHGTGGGFNPSDAVSDKAFQEAERFANAEVAVGGFSSYLNVNTATLASTVLAALFVSWTSFQSSDSSKLISLKARAQDADNFIDQVVHKLGMTQLNITNHDEVEQKLSVLADQHQKCLQDESSIDAMFGHLQQHAEEGWMFGDDKTKASMAFDRISKELKLDVLKPEASAMQLESIVTKMQKCHVGQSGMQMQITRLAEIYKI